jgi:putative FmdB family regulatory protein
VPTYQYACTACGHRFEAVQAFTDESLTTCAVCSGQLRKVYGSVGVVFKGSGFYRTDSRNGKTSTGAPASGEKSSEKSDQPAAKSDSPLSGSSGSSDSKPTSTTGTSSSSISSSSTSSTTKAAS